MNDGLGAVPLCCTEPAEELLSSKIIQCYTSEAVHSSSRCTRICFFERDNDWQNNN
jgi:hypothetical protein